MNGESGEFVGNIPLDKNKAVIMSILLFYYNICFYFSYFIYCI